jgi:predicted enzyme related to lactoylglutathione lyase
MAEFAKPRVVGLNHVALEVGDVDEALAFYGRLFRFELRSKSNTMAFIDLGDQFIALQKGRRQAADDGRHFGLVVDDKEAARRALEAAGVALLDGPFLDFRDPWGNRVEIVGYDNIQFTKAPNVLRGMGLMHLVKNEKAKKELADKGMALD